MLVLRYCFTCWMSNIHMMPLSLTHWGRMTHIYIYYITIIGSDNGLSPGRRQAIIWTSAGILLIGPLGTNFSEILTCRNSNISIQENALENVVCEMTSILSRPQCVKLSKRCLDLTGSMWPCDAIWRQKYWSNLVGIMTFTLSHHLYQCWHILG